MLSHVGQFPNPEHFMADRTNTPTVAANPATADATVPVLITIAGTKGGAFRFKNNRMDQFRLDFKGPLSHEKAKRLAEFFVELVND